MEIKLVEATSDNLNYGKFAIGRWTDEEWSQETSGIASTPGWNLLQSIGWRRFVLVVLPNTIWKSTNRQMNSKINLVNVSLKSRVCVNHARILLSGKNHEQRRN